MKISRVLRQLTFYLILPEIGKWLDLPSLYHYSYILLTITIENRK
jgi:hypothetical protein